MNNKLSFIHKPKKRYGQNFLKNKNIINQIVNIINPKYTDILVEIGPGLGALTKPIINIVNNIIVIEIDSNLASFLKERTNFGNKLTIFQQDAMTFNFFKIKIDKGKKIRIFGNLPYNISTPFLFHLFKYISLIKDMYFMMQKEVVSRLIAKPNCKEYGRLSVLTQYYCQIIPLIEVSKKFFTPSPKVDSTMVKLLPYDNQYYPKVNMNKLKYILTCAFNKRRKFISNSLSSLFKIETFHKLDINPMLRAENLSITQYCQLAIWLNDNIINKNI